LLKEPGGTENEDRRTNEPGATAKRMLESTKGDPRDREAPAFAWIAASIFSLLAMTTLGAAKCLMLWGSA
jgi:hypothetical protein